MTSRKSLRAVLALGLAIALVPTRTAAQEDRPSLIGVYDCRGVNAEGVEYTASVVIAVHGESLLVIWRPVQSDGTLASEPDAAGVAMVNGSTLAVSFYGKSGSGLVVYTIEGDRLVGQRTMAGGNGDLYPEVLNRIAGHPAPEPVPPTNEEALGAPSPQPRTARALRAI